MQEKLLDYLLGELDPEACRELEAALLRDDWLRAELERLKACLEGDSPHEPPQDLAERTCELVAQNEWIAQDSDDTSLPVVPVTTLAAAAPLEPSANSYWSTTDLAVAAGVVLATAMFLMPALQESRFLARRNQCQANLINLAVPLNLYAQLHNGDIPDRGRQTRTIRGGDVPFLLVQQSVVDPQTAYACVICPDSAYAEELRRRRTPMPLPSRREAIAQAVDSQLLRRLEGSLAFRIGYVSGNQYWPWRSDRSARSPVMSDAPSYAAPDFRSENHRGLGANVLFADGHVEFISGCPSLACGDKLFVNGRNLRAPGIDPGDAVLIGGGETIDLSLDLPR